MFNIIKLSEENKKELAKRLRSLAWRAGGLIAALILSESTELLNLFEMPQWLTLGVGLGIGELTKLLKNKGLI